MEFFGFAWRPAEARFFGFDETFAALRGLV